MRVLGLTGGIATGKSTVAGLLKELGATIIDADKIARDIVAPGQEAWQEIVNQFGVEILRPDQTINREKLRKIVFADPEARRKLESITHPRIRTVVQERIASLASQGAPIVIYEAPLLFENGIHHWLRPVILVTCSPETQRTRLAKRDHLSPAEVEQHLDAQMPLAQKRGLADYIIENSGDLQSLKKSVQKLWNRINSPSPAQDTYPGMGPRARDPRPE
jgi:dephospho-CoA kinase